MPITKLALNSTTPLLHTNHTKKLIKIQARKELFPTEVVIEEEKRAGQLRFFSVRFQ